MSDALTESQEQKSVIRWWSIACHGYGLSEFLLMACPAQAARSPAGWGRIKAEGYRTGTPDLMLATPRGQWHGLFVEMKRTVGSATTEFQKEMLMLLSQQGYRIAVAYGAEQARKVIAEYLTP